MLQLASVKFQEEERRVWRRRKRRRRRRDRKRTAHDVDWYSSFLPLGHLASGWSAAVS
jgi:hypothetical protein